MTHPEAAPGWYPDPYDGAVERYWSGERWEGASRPHTDSPSRTVPPVAAPGPTLPTPGLLWPVVTVAAGAVMALGSFLPWAVLTGSFGERASVAGTSGGGNGWISFAFGLVIVIAGAVSVPRPQRLATVTVDVGALAAVVLTIYEYGHLTTESGVLSSGNAGGIYDVGLGLGLGLVAVAAVVALICAAGITGRDARALR